ncbi:MAG: DUF4180 domain-containing protein [Bacteroidales bacterium]
MDFRIINKDGSSYLELTDPGFKINDEQDAVDLAAICRENGTSKMLVSAENLTNDFYDLSTRLAGNILQKFSNYRMIFAAVVPAHRVKGRFGEMALEMNRGKQFHISTEKQDAENWLAGLPDM